MAIDGRVIDREIRDYPITEEAREVIVRSLNPHMSNEQVKRMIESNKKRFRLHLAEIERGHNERMIRFGSYDLKDFPIPNATTRLKHLCKHLWAYLTQPIYREARGLG